MLNIDNKFEIGQEVYLITGRNVRIEDKRTCDVCLGVGTVTYKGYEITCPKCNGEKNIVLDSKVATVHTVEYKPYRIVSYRYTVCKDGEFLRYRVKHDNDGKEKSILEEEIFTTKEEAEARCKELNEEESENDG